MRKNLGIDPVTASIIVSLITQGINLGLSAYTAAQQAKEQAKLQRELENAEISSIANSLALQTGISFSQWYIVVRMTFSPSMPNTEPSPEPKQKDNTIMYIAFGALALLILLRR